jgi:hypothetical protein
MVTEIERLEQDNRRLQQQIEKFKSGAIRTGFGKKQADGKGAASEIAGLERKVAANKALIAKRRVRSA